MWIYKFLPCAGAEKISVNWWEPKNLKKCNQLWRWRHLNDGTRRSVTCWLGYQVYQQMESAGSINNISPGLSAFAIAIAFAIRNSQLAFRHRTSIHLPIQNWTQNIYMCTRIVGCGSSTRKVAIHEPLWWMARKVGILRVITFRVHLNLYILNISHF